MTSPGTHPDLRSYHPQSRQVMMLVISSLRDASSADTELRAKVHAAGFRPQPRDLRKEPQSKKAEGDEEQRTDRADVRALGKKEHSDYRGSRCPDAYKGCVDRCCRQAFNRFGEQIIYRDRTNDTDEQRSPSGYRR